MRSGTRAATRSSPAERGHTRMVIGRGVLPNYLIRQESIPPKFILADKLGIDSSLDRNPWNMRLWAGRFGVKVLPGRGRI